MPKHTLAVRHGAAVCHARSPQEAAEVMLALCRQRGADDQVLGIVTPSVLGAAADAVAVLGEATLSKGLARQRSREARPRRTWSATSKRWTVQLLY